MVKKSLAIGILILFLVLLASAEEKPPLKIPRPGDSLPREDTLLYPYPRDYPLTRELLEEAIANKYPIVFTLVWFPPSHRQSLSISIVNNPFSSPKARHVVEIGGLVGYGYHLLEYTFPLDEKWYSEVQEMAGQVPWLDLDLRGACEGCRPSYWEYDATKPDGGGLRVPDGNTFNGPRPENTPGYKIQLEILIPPQRYNSFYTVCTTKRNTEDPGWKKYFALWDKVIEKYKNFQTIGGFAHRIVTRVIDNRWAEDEEDLRYIPKVDLHLVENDVQCLVDMSDTKAKVYHRPEGGTLVTEGGGSYKCSEKPDAYAEATQPAPIEWEVISPPSSPSPSPNQSAK